MGRRLLASLALCVLASCFAAVNTTPSLEPATALDPELGYVAGRFSFTGPMGWGARLAFEVQPREGTGLHLGFGEPSEQGSWEVRMIPVPPGIYRVESWVAYDSSGAELKREESSRGLEDAFVVLPGHVVFLGSFRAHVDRSTTYSGGRLGRRIEWRFRGELTRADEVLSVVRDGYPKFAAAPVDCLLCSAPEAGVASYARPALTPQKAAAQGIALPEPAVVPAKAKARKPSKEVNEKGVPVDHDGLW